MEVIFPPKLVMLVKSRPSADSKVINVHDNHNTDCYTMLKQPLHPNKNRVIVLVTSFSWQFFSLSFAYTTEPFC